jgi:hypothetical protein
MNEAEAEPSQGSADQGQSDASKELAIQAVAGFIGGIAGVATGVPGVVIVPAAAPYMLELLRRAWAEFGVRRLDSAAGVIAGASEELHVEPDEVLDLARSSPERVELLAAALLAASHTFNQQKVRALATAVANGLGDDDARVDQERLIVAALADLEAPHIKLLDYMARDDWLGFFQPIEYWAEAGGQARSVTVVLMAALHHHGLVESNEAMQNEESDEWLSEVVDKELGRIYELLDAMLDGRLPRGPDLRPVEHRPQPDPTIKWRATDFGVTCAHYLRPEQEQQNGATETQD